MKDDWKRTLTHLAAVPTQGWAIIFGLFAMGVGNYMVIPFFALYCTEELKLTAVQVGLALTVRLWSQRGCSLFGGMLSDRFTPRRVMMLGLFLRFLGFVGIAHSRDFSALVGCTALTGIGAALYTPAGKAALVTLCSDENKLFILSLRSTAYNCGAALGPVVGLLGTYLSYRMTLWGGGCLFILTAGIIALLVTDASGPLAFRTKKRAAVKSVVTDPRVLVLCLVMLVFFAYYVQIELTLPLYAAKSFSRSAVTVLFVVSAAANILLQLPLATRVERLNTPSAVAVGFACSGLGFVLFSSPLGMVSFVAGVFIFSISEILLEPKIDSELSRIVPPALLGTGFGLASLACSIGGALGHEGGAVGLRLAEQLGSQSFFFLALGIVGLGCAWALPTSIRRFL